MITFGPLNSLRGQFNHFEMASWSFSKPHSKPTQYSGPTKHPKHLWNAAEPPNHPFKAYYHPQAPISPQETLELTLGRNFSHNKSRLAPFHLIFEPVQLQSSQNKSLSRHFEPAACSVFVRTSRMGILIGIRLPSSRKYIFCVSFT